MAGQQDNHKHEIQQIINQIREALKPKVSAEEFTLLSLFIQRYYGASSFEDLSVRSIQQLAGAVWSHWNLSQMRKPREIRVHIFNPTMIADGWESTHTIIQISQDNTPFLVDTTRMEINREGLQIHFSIHFGGVKVKRNSHYQISEVLPMDAMDAEASIEAPIYFEVDHLLNEEAIAKLKANIERVLYDVQIAVLDWRKMVNQAEQSLMDLEQNPPPLDPAEIAESKDFLRWLINNHFTFLGCRDYKLIGDETNRALQIVPGSGLGVLRDDSESTVSRHYADMPPQARKLALSKHILIIAKTNTRSTVHRDAYTDYIGVKRFNDKGELIGERRFVGLYTSTAYHSSPRYIPFLRHQVAKVIQEFHYPADSHNGKEIVHILETLPRDDLFQATHEELVELTAGILHLQERKQIRLFVRKDAYGRYFSCLVYLPREIFNTELCTLMEEVLVQTLQGKESTFQSYFSDSVLARIHFVIRVNPKKPIIYDVGHIQNKLVTVARSWNDEFFTHLIKQFGQAKALAYFQKYRKAFPSSYTEYYSPVTALNDLETIEKLSHDNPLGMIFARHGADSLRLKLFHFQSTIALSDVLPTLENMGLRVVGERPHEIVFKEGVKVWINDFDLVYVKNEKIDIEHLKENFQEAFANIWFHNAEDDGFNQLVLAADLSWHEVAFLRGYVKYLRQIGFTFSQPYIEQTLINNAGIARDLVELFKLRFSPDYLERPSIDFLLEKIHQSLDAVSSLDEDRILRRILEVILATVRTNYFQKTPIFTFKPYISFKFKPELISDLPLPKPYYEIFVYSPRVEGVHLRGGKVARGGLRWSDRREDFRTEVLGLMKAQQVKNSVIVPVGAKGGFYPKKLPEGDRDAILKEAIACYQTFIRALLDITDNIVNNQIMPPQNVVCYDEEDPYLVVAADKGTATFSDIANEISKEYNFWLGDAFASGGSAGYDHKKMGITARGAWESVKRHFRELNIDPSQDDFTVIGIGDMSGDVFGNGLLYSNHIKLVAAFNHMHIFLDPDPNPEKSFVERQRLFNLPRSTWMDYDPTLISNGGGVYSRSAKSIHLSKEVKALLNIESIKLTPNELIQAILKAPVDLLWNGGIGTYVKSREETHADVGDRANDAIRINGEELRVRVVGEGGNLGFTQLGRIEYSLNGGILYTDFIDNSGGVDCSDHEVNIKILLNKEVFEGHMTLAERDILLEQMTEEVAYLVLRDNYEQTQILSLEASVVLQTLDLFRRYMLELEKTERLNTRLEFLPSEKTLLERKTNGQGLTRPELAILIAYTKMFLKQQILASDLPENPYFVRHLKMAFPKVLSEKFLPQMREHSLRREIIATQLAKSVTDHMGVNFVERLQRETGASIAFILRAYVIAEGIFQMETLWRQIEALDYQVKVAIQQKMMLRLYYLIRRATRWFLRTRTPDVNIEETILDYVTQIKELIQQIETLLSPLELQWLEQETESLFAEGVPHNLARRVATSSMLFTSLDIVEAARRENLPLTNVAKTYYALGAQLDLNWLREQMNSYPMENQWDELARSGLRDDLDREQRELSISVLSDSTIDSDSIEGRIEAWLERYHFAKQRWQKLIGEIKSSNNMGFVTYSVVLRELSDFTLAG